MQGCFGHGGPNSSKIPDRHTAIGKRKQILHRRGNVRSGLHSFHEYKVRNNTSQFYRQGFHSFVLDVRLHPTHRYIPNRDSKRCTYFFTLSALDLYRHRAALDVSEKPSMFPLTLLSKLSWANLANLFNYTILFHRSRSGTFELKSFLLGELTDGAFDGLAEQFGDFGFCAFEMDDKSHRANKLPVLEEMLAFCQFR